MIEINNLTSKSVDEEFLKKVAKKVFLGENKKRVGLSIALVGEGRIKELNKKYRKKNRATDVLAFEENFNFWKDKNLGEIIICPAVVEKNAKKFGEDFKKELARVLIHGILHLFGYNHEVFPEKAKKMEEKQSYYLSELKIQ